MGRVRLTKGELKWQRDRLKQYERYLPTLQLKKQQLQLEIAHQASALEVAQRQLEARRGDAQHWAGLLAEAPEEFPAWASPTQVVTGSKNVAGVDIPLFEQIIFAQSEYDLFLVPLWVDRVLVELRKMVTLQKEIQVIQQGIAVLRQELRITTQRVNLFEKVKIPEAREAIRLIKIYLGDQMASAVGRSKIAKNRIEEGMLQEVAA